MSGMPTCAMPYLNGQPPQMLFLSAETQYAFTTVVAGLVGCYYNVIIAWCIFYLWSSMNVSGEQF